MLSHRETQGDGVGTGVGRMHTGAEFACPPVEHIIEPQQGVAGFMQPPSPSFLQVGDGAGVGTGVGTGVGRMHTGAEFACPPVEHIIEPQQGVAGFMQPPSPSFLQVGVGTGVGAGAEQQFPS